MKPKPNLNLRGFRAKSIAAAGLAMAGCIGLSVAQTTPALADPTEHYVAVGSDTIQDIMNQVSLDLGQNTLGSYNATNPVTGTAHEVITPVDGSASVNCSFARPNGSSEGVAALRFSVSSASGATPPTPTPQAGCVDIARSSSGPGSNASATGQFVYIPFALDAVAGSTGPATAGTIGGVAAVATSITQANSFTLADLKTLYASCGQVTEGGVTYWPFEAGVTQPTGTQRIDLYAPQPGSGTLSYWAGQLGFSATAPPACVNQTIVQGTDTGTAVEEHDGTAVATDTDGYGPFSVSQWIGQRNGHNDRRHGAQLTSISGINPYSNGNPTTGLINTSFPLVREVYNVVQYSRVVGSSTDAGLVSMLVGTSSFVCQDSLEIHSYGFATLSSATTDLCGATTAGLRAFANG